MPAKPPPAYSPRPHLPLFPRSVLAYARWRLAFAKVRHWIARERLHRAEFGEFVANLRAVNAGKRLDALQARLGADHAA